MKTRYLITTLMTFSLALFLSQAALAAEPEPGVARLSLIHGDVSTMRGDTGDWGATTINAPIVRGDSISTAARSRAEVELDHANILRLDQRTEAKIADLSRTHMQVQVSQGTVSFTVFKGTEADVEIDTPNVAVRPLGEGIYRVQVNSQAETEVTVRKGEAEVSTPQGSSTVEKGQLIEVRGTDSPEYQVAKARGQDEWDQWNRERDHVIEDASAWGYTNRKYTGAHDLDRYGHWRHTPDYGDVWSPDEPQDWVPYHDGRWVWEPYWGWTWASYEPWGWAPYHYGRWFLWDDAWCWWPGFVTPAFVPVWSPAWVSFVGFGFGRHFFAGVGFGFGFNSIGWCPLAPFDPFFPWWGFGNTFNVVNVTNITNITNIRNITNTTNGGTVTGLTTAGKQPVLANLQKALADPRARRAITTVPVQEFAKGRIPRNTQPVNAAALRQAHVVSGTLPVVPTRDSLRPVNRRSTGGSAPTHVATAGHFFSKRPAPPAPESFAGRAAAIRQMVQHYKPSAASNSGAMAGRVNANGASAVNGNSRTNAPAASTTQPTNRQNPSTARANGGQQQRTPQSRRFGAGNSESNAATGGVASGPRRSTQSGRETKPGATTPTETTRLRREQPASGWHRFGESNPRLERTTTARSQAGAANAPAEKQREAVTPRSQPASKVPADRSNWQKFSSGTKAANPTASRPASGENGAPRTFSPRQVPTTSREQQGGWQKFNSGTRQAPTERTRSFSAPQAESRRGEQFGRSSRPAGGGGWTRFTAQPERAPTIRSQGSFSGPREPARTPPEWRSPVHREAPRSFERPPLEMRRPIVSERAPRGNEGGGNRGGWGGGGNRGGSGGGERGGSHGGSGAGHSSSPAPQQSSGQGHKH